MIAFIDECLPVDSFRRVLEERGHTVLSVGEGFPSGSPDRSILAAADRQSAVIFSADSHWKTLISQTEGGGFRRAGRVLFNCSHTQAITRLHELVPDIEREHAVAVTGGRQLMMRITNGNFRIER